LPSKPIIFRKRLRKYIGAVGGKHQQRREKIDSVIAAVVSFGPTAPNCLRSRLFSESDFENISELLVENTNSGVKKSLQ
jgi:hypothetical protein